MKASNLIEDQTFNDSEWSQNYEHFYLQAFLYRISRFLRGLSQLE